MCSKLGEACLCRLAVHLSRLSGLRELDVAENDLGILPEPVFELPELETLDISGGFRFILNPKLWWVVGFVLFYNKKRRNISARILSNSYFATCA